MPAGVKKITLNRSQMRLGHVGAVIYSRHKPHYFVAYFRGPVADRNDLSRSCLRYGQQNQAQSYG